MKDDQTTFDRVTEQPRKKSKNKGFISNLKKSYFPKAILPSLIINVNN